MEGGSGKRREGKERSQAVIGGEMEMKGRMKMGEAKEIIRERREKEKRSGRREKREKGKTLSKIQGREKKGTYLTQLERRKSKRKRKNGGEESNILVLTAPAGTGKTYLLYEYDLPIRIPEVYRYLSPTRAPLRGCAQDGGGLEEEERG